MGMGSSKKLKKLKREQSQFRADQLRQAHEDRRREKLKKLGVFGYALEDAVRKGA